MTVTARPGSGYVNANGILQHYLEWGNPDAPAVLMLHGIGLCASVWSYTASRLARDYRVLSLDLRGHGDSEKPGTGYTFEELGRDLAAVVPALGLHCPFAVGHSAGGSAAIIAQALVPGTLGATVIIDSRVGGSRAMSSRPDLRDRPARTRRKRMVWESRDAIYQGYRQRPVFRTWNERVFADYIDGGTRPLPDSRVELKCPPEVEATFYEQRAALDSSHYVAGLRGEYLVLLGNYPGAQTPDDAGILQFIRETGPAEVKVAPRGSHFLPMEEPEWVTGEILDYFRGRPGGGFGTMS